ncbi:hypothetical protein EB796_019439 [Bugula neritina]|uniref:Uncharacterized protein n=1 Tax=Bugula neritina TaxID=10212 RepID=A0A7J7J960_BUGNE|nr:hypothetical protein EB796_019439 [Bugula neritina]
MYALLNKSSSLSAYFIPNSFHITSIEYAYFESPINMQGIVMGLLWLARGIGNLIGIALLYRFQYSENILSSSKYLDCNRFDWYFFILAIFMLIFSFIFICISKCCDLSLDSVIVETHRRRNNSETESASATPQLPRRRAVIPVNFESSAE